MLEAKGTSMTSPSLLLERSAMRKSKEDRFRKEMQQGKIDITLSLHALSCAYGLSGRKIRNIMRKDKVNNG